MKRENQKFQGVLSDKELYLIEDALEAYDCDGPLHREIKNLVQKLYSDFSKLE